MNHTEEKNSGKIGKNASQEDDDDPKNFIPTDTGPGSLLKAKCKVEHVMRIKDRQFINLEEGENVLSLFDFTNIKTKERVLVFLIGETRYMFMTKDFDENFEVLFEGTCHQHNMKQDSSMGLDVSVDDIIFEK